MLLLIALLGCPKPTDDADGDGLPASLDCDDADPAVLGQTQWYEDGDLDGFGGGEPRWDCAAASFETADGGDCDDGQPDVNPDATETCNGADDDCDEDVDEGLPTETFYA